MKRAIFAAVLTSLGTVTQAGLPIVVGAEAAKSGGNWRFDVTIRHADTGWDHYANGWGVYLEDGTELGYRVLVHPHVDEQPFTRSLGSVKIPSGITRVKIIPNDSVHGTGEAYFVELK